MIYAVIISVFLSGVSLAADAFAVSICDGMVYRDLTRKKAALIPTTFGFFQAAMPIIGFYVGLAFLDKIEAFDHWIAFGLLVFIGGKMIFDGAREIKAPEEELKPKKFSIAELMVQGVATSIDALAVGFTLNTMLAGLENTQLWAWISVAIIGVTTFFIALGGVIIGVRVGKLFRKKASWAEIIGGLVLIAIAIKIVIESYL